MSRYVERFELTELIEKGRLPSFYLHSVVILSTDLGRLIHLDFAFSTILLCSIPTEVCSSGILSVAKGKILV